MADDRYGYDRDRDEQRRRRESGRRDEDGYIARRGFGNETAGYGRGRSDEGGRSGFERGGSYDRGRDDRQGGGRERDYGDSAGYGTGGSARDWRDVMGDDRGRGGQGYGGFMGEDRGRGGQGYGGFERDRGFGAGSGGRDEHSRYGAGDFGRGSRGDQDERGFLERAGDEIRSWFGDDDADRRRMRDAREGDAGAQHHRGRGPKNYQRSDERIRDDVNDRLTDDPHVDASEIEVSVQNREVTLSGTVTSRFEKRHAEDIAESVSGVAHVQNNLRVRQGASMGSGPGSATGDASTGGASGSMGGASGSLGAASGNASGAGLAVGSATGAGPSPGTDAGNRSGGGRRSSNPSDT